MATPGHSVASSGRVPSGLLLFDSQCGWSPAVTSHSVTAFLLVLPVRHVSKGRDILMSRGGCFLQGLFLAEAPGQWP